MRPLLPLIALALALSGPACQTVWEPPGGGTGGGGPTIGPSLVGIGLSPVNPKVTLGEQIKFTATGFYDNQTTVEITDTVEWASSEPGVLAVSSDLDSEGLGTTLTAGKSQVRANFFDIESNLITVTVTEALIEELTVTPETGQIHVDGTLQLTAEAAFSDGSRGNVNGSVTWLTGDGTIVTVDPAGKVTGKGPGSTTVSARYEQGEIVLEATDVSIEVVGDEVAIDEADVRIIGFNTVATADGITYTLEVKNSGGATASGFWIDVWLNRTAAPDPPPTSGDQYEYIEVLEPTDVVEVAIDVPTSPGTFQSWALVDSFANVIEGSMGENNNVWGPQTVSMSGQGGPIGPDVGISYFQAFVQADQVLYVVDVTNTGDEEATSFHVGVFSNPGFPPAAGGSPDEVAEVASLLPGDTATLTLELRALPESPWQSYVLADVDGVVTEPNEDNNVSGFLVFP